MKSYVDSRAGLVDRRIFSREDVFRQEMRTVFRNYWLFIGPAEWVARPGDFYATFMGQTPVLLWRDRRGELWLFVNRCPRGNDRLTELDRGNADGFVCKCHGHRFLDHSDPAAEGLKLIPRHDQYGELVFACVNASAPELRNQIGEFSWYLSMIEGHSSGGLEFYGGGALRWTVRANWKLAAEAYCGDLHRDDVCHQATRLAMGGEPSLSAREGFQASVGGGAMVVATDKASASHVANSRFSASNDLRASMSPIAATMFPNLSYDGRTRTLHVWHPKGPSETEVHTYCLADRDESVDSKERRRKTCQLRFGPAGLESADDESVWAAITRAATASRERPFALNLQMGLGEELRMNVPGKLASLVSEMNQRAFFDWWQRAVSCPDLDDNGSSHTYLAKALGVLARWDEVRN